MISLGLSSSSQIIWKVLGRDEPFCSWGFNSWPIPGGWWMLLGQHYSPAGQGTVLCQIHLFPQIFKLKKKNWAHFTSCLCKVSSLKATFCWPLCIDCINAKPPWPCYLLLWSLHSVIEWCLGVFPPQDRYGSYWWPRNCNSQGSQQEALMPPSPGVNSAGLS